MDNKDLITHVNDSATQLITQDVPAELIELSEEDLGQVVGGGGFNIELLKLVGVTLDTD